MKQRCNNPKNKKYYCYGARGIKVHPDFEDFEVWLAELGPRPDSAHSVDRIDNNKGYEPGNIRWADLETQHSNTRNNVHITYQGVTKTLAQWSRALGGCPELVRDRLLRGWTEEDAVTRPVRRQRSKRNP